MRDESKAGRDEAAVETHGGSTIGHCVCEIRRYANAYLIVIECLSGINGRLSSRITVPLYYDRGTPSGGSADPLWRATQVRRLLRTGWGPRGDSGSARGRVRATQPATLFLCFLSFTNQSVPKEGLSSPSLSFGSIGSRLAI